MDLIRSNEESDTTTDQQTGSDSDSWIDRAKAKYGLGALVAGIGLVLFVIPEPLTSTAGIGLMLLGGAIWVADKFR